MGGKRTDASDAARHSPTRNMASPHAVAGLAWRLGAPLWVPCAALAVSVVLLAALCLTRAPAPPPDGKTFLVPLFPLTPALGLAVNVHLFWSLHWETMAQFGAWLLAGAAVYCLHGVHAAAAAGEGTAAFVDRCGEEEGGRGISGKKEKGNKGLTAFPAAASFGVRHDPAGRAETRSLHARAAAAPPFPSRIPRVACCCRHESDPGPSVEMGRAGGAERGPLLWRAGDTADEGSGQEAASSVTFPNPPPIPSPFVT